MITPILTENTTDEYVKPVEWNYGAYTDFPLLYVTVREPYMISYWKVNWLDRLRILFGKPLCLTLIGYKHPATRLMVTSIHKE